MAKINPYELINQEYTNANGDIYTVKAYIEKEGQHFDDVNGDE